MSDLITQGQQHGTQVTQGIDFQAMTAVIALPLLIHAGIQAAEATVILAWVPGTFSMAALIAAVVQSGAMTAVDAQRVFGGFGV